MKIILIETCSDCPYIVNACMGKKPVCNHPKLMVKFPYSNDRRVSPISKPPEICPLNDGKEEYDEINSFGRSQE